MTHRDPLPNSRISCRFGCRFRSKLKKISNLTLPDRASCSSIIPLPKQRPISYHHTLGASPPHVLWKRHTIWCPGKVRKRHIVLPRTDPTYFKYVFTRICYLHTTIKSWNLFFDIWSQNSFGWPNVFVGDVQNGSLSKNPGCQLRYTNL